MKSYKKIKPGAVTKTAYLGLITRTDEQKARDTLPQPTATNPHSPTREDMGDISKGLRIMATLDWKTCQKCGELDGTSWTWEQIERGEMPRVPHHDGCRCLELPWLIEPELIGLPTLNWKRTRPSALGQVPQDTTWNEWIKSHPSSEY
ncbi:hypothetical protein HUK76_20385 [Citrobacter portucalensis]|uniref:hypothetical protein n=1 Tax=Citrobacter portucalensis TaxID=1639133 RepID=UPI00157FFA4B|nr:hypothetical protein [Citrobacter portucalensis]NUH56014.1 hypothetical protein [Citrobacter portucalensis]